MAGARDRAILARLPVPHGRRAGKTWVRGMDAVFVWILLAGVCLAAAVAVGLLAWRRAAVHRQLVEMVEGLPNPLQLVDRRGLVLHSNAAAREFCGGERCLDAVLAERLPAAPDTLGDGTDPVEAGADALTRLATNARNGATGSAELHLHPRRSAGDGEAWVRVTVRPLAGLGGALLWQLEDITARRQMEATIRAEQARLVDLFERAPIGFYSVDAQGRFGFVNQTFAEWLGRPAEALTAGMTLHEILADPPPANAPAYAPFAEGALQGEVRLRGPGGQPFDAQIVQAVAAADDSGEEGELHTRSVVRHLTAGRAAARALERSERRFKRFFDEAPIAIVELDRGGRLRESNPAFAALLGESAQAAILGEPLARWVEDEDRGKLRAALLAAREHGGQDRKSVV